MKIGNRGKTMFWKAEYSFWKWDEPGSNLDTWLEILKVVLNLFRILETNEKNIIVWNLLLDQD